MKPTFLLLALSACQAPLDQRASFDRPSAERLLDSGGSPITLSGSTDTGTVFGHAVVVIGDTNGDGYAETAVGAMNDASSYGRVYVAAGTASGPRGGTPAQTYDGEAEGSKFGATLGAVGDVDGDGQDDLAVGAYGYDDNTGRVYLYFSGVRGLSATPDVILDGPTAGGMFGFSIAGLGDVNGDGIDDMAVGAYGLGTGTGSVFIYLGAVGGPSTTATTTLGGFASSAFGYAVAGADTNGDGYNEVIVGAPTQNSDKGAIYLFPGGAKGVRETYSLTIEGENEGDSFGCEIADAGDANHDLAHDVLVGAYGYNGGDGRAYFFPASRVGLGSTATWTTDGEASNLGRTIVADQDFDADGYPDVALGEAQYGSSTGRVRLYPGNGTTFDAYSDEVSGTAESDLFGVSIGAGDVNGDGAPDLAVGAQGVGDGLGATYLYLAPTPPDNDGDGFAGSRDCDDTDAMVYPGSRENPGDDIDQNCDGVELCFIDADGDEYRSADEATIESADIDCADDGEASMLQRAGDCDDANPDVHPDATDTPDNGIDEDCDGSDATSGDTGDTGADTGDTGGDTGETGDSGETGDTGPIDDTGDTNETGETGDSGDSGDSAGDDTAAADDTGGEKDGGCGCASGSTGSTGALGLLVAGAALLRRRR